MDIHRERTANCQLAPDRDRNGHVSGRAPRSRRGGTRVTVEAYLIGIEDEISKRVATRCHRDATDAVVSEYGAHDSDSF